MISQCDVETTKTYCTICITITYSLVNIESEFKYENQGLMEKNSYFVQHITIAQHTYFSFTYQRKFSFKLKGNENIIL